METRCPRKYILKITKKATETTDKFVLDFKLLQQKFSEVVELPDGNIVKIKVRKYSSISTDQFSLVDTCERNYICHLQ